MAGVVVNVLEVNRVRHVALGGIIAALSAALEDELPEPSVAGGVRLERARQLLAGLRGLALQPLPEHLLDTTAGVPLELEASRHELEQLADELEAMARLRRDPLDGLHRAAELVRERAAAKR